MSTFLVIALSVEGRTDERFLPILVQRTTESILLRFGRKTVDVLEPILIKARHPYRDNTERMLIIAKEAAGYHALVIHADADYPTAERALKERFYPGLDRVRVARQNGEVLCEHLIPIIPVQMVESWMLADMVTLHSIIGTKIPVNQLGGPLHPHQVESIAEPKQLLLDIVSRALSDRTRRRRNVRQEITYLQEPLARQIGLEELRKVPAFLQFEQELHKALRDMQLSE
jgi:hypothetical protein